MNKHKHVIVGGGFSGLRIARLLANRDDIDVIVINPQSSFEYHGSLYRSANGYSPLETAISYRELFKDANIEYCQELMVDIDPMAKQIKLLGGGTQHYDSATLALGYEPEYFGIPGMREFSYTLYSLADALRLRTALKKLAEKTAHSTSPAKVLVIGGGPTGVEVAATIPHFFSLATANKNVDITLIEAQERILGGMSESFSHLTEQSLPNQITIQLQQRVIRATKDLLYMADSQPTPFDILIWTAGSSANGYFKQRPDLFRTDHKGRVLVNERLGTSHDSLYVVGDSAAVEFSGTAYAAIEMGSYVAEDVIANIQGQAHVNFVPSRPNYAVPTGHEAAVAMQADAILTEKEGWDVRRQLDLDALLLIAPEDVARYHWAKGESLARMFENNN